MRFDIITCAPKLLHNLFQYGIIKRTLDKGIAKLFIHNLHDYGIGKYKKIDDKPYGTQAGMVLMVAPIVNCIEKLQGERTYDHMIALTPEGQLLTQPIANQLSLKKNILLLCGHYKGIDERIYDLFPIEKISIGEYILPGGELPAAILAQSILRLLPGAISDETSALSDSFQDNMISSPVYTRPSSFRQYEVPPVLTSGNHEKIADWQEKQSRLRTENYLKKNKK